MLIALSFPNALYVTQFTHTVNKFIHQRKIYQQLVNLLDHNYINKKMKNVIISAEIHS